MKKQTKFVVISFFKVTIISILMRLYMFITTGISDHFNASVSGSAVLLSFILVKYLYNKKMLNDNLVITYSVYAFFSLVLGVLFEFYMFIESWDILMHLFSGIALAIYADYLLKSTNTKANKLIHFIFVISFATTVGVLWEVYEFSIDRIMNLDTQHHLTTGVIDTMIDLIADFIGAIISAIYLILKKK